MTCTLTKSDLRQYICEECSYLKLLNDEEINEFMVELDDNGIETVE